MKKALPGAQSGQQHPASAQHCLFWSLPSPAAYRDAQGDCPTESYWGTQRCCASPLLRPGSQILLALTFTPASLLSICAPWEPRAASQLLLLYFSLSCFFKTSCSPFFLEMTQVVLFLWCLFIFFNHCVAEVHILVLALMQLSKRSFLPISCNELIPLASTG